ncbi:hypothetical protein ARMGADRAFT_1026498 [Armillaria gallica]|uniref:Uncharacterized protein n=1 Tax=Armillaria gallica TaxID=47427 RepID=A0A2H3E5T5_ARMGA|nr:hypothetical protein ARMGADRAFT_1026498 [Armillaria gallica]
MSQNANFVQKWPDIDAINAMGEPILVWYSDLGFNSRHARLSSTQYAVCVNASSKPPLLRELEHALIQVVFGAAAGIFRVEIPLKRILEEYSVRCEESEFSHEDLAWFGQSLSIRAPEANESAITPVDSTATANRSPSLQQSENLEGEEGDVINGGDDTVTPRYNLQKQSATQAYNDDLSTSDPEGDDLSGEEDGHPGNEGLQDKAGHDDDEELEDEDEPVNDEELQDEDEPDGNEGLQDKAGHDDDDDDDEELEDEDEPVHNDGLEDEDKPDGDKGPQDKAGHDDDEELEDEDEPVHDEELQDEDEPDGNEGLQDKAGHDDDDEELEDEEEADGDEGLQGDEECEGADATDEEKSDGTEGEMTHCRVPHRGIYPSGSQKDALKRLLGPEEAASGPYHHLLLNAGPVEFSRGRPVLAPPVRVHCGEPSERELDPTPRAETRRHNKLLCWAGWNLRKKKLETYKVKVSEAAKRIGNKVASLHVIGDKASKGAAVDDQGAAKVVIENLWCHYNQRCGECAVEVFRKCLVRVKTGCEILKCWIGKVDWGRCTVNVGNGDGCGDDTSRWWFGWFSSDTFRWRWWRCSGLRSETFGASGGHEGLPSAFQWYNTLWDDGGYFCEAKADPKVEDILGSSKMTVLQ